MADINEYSKHFLDQTGLSQVWTKVKAEDAKVQANVDAEVARAQAAEATKVDKEISTAAGKALVFNESDGGGIKFEGSEHWSAVAANNSDAFPDTSKGIGAQLYDWKMNGTSYERGSVLDVTENGIYYYNGAYAGYATRDVDDNLLVVKKDIKDLAGGMHFIGVVTQGAGETIEQAIERVYTEAGKSYSDRKAGDVVIIKTSDSDKEFICDSSKNWVELGDQGIYATKAELAAEADTRSTADATLQSNIDAEETRATAAEATKTDKEVTGTNGKALVFNESDGGGAKFENNSGIESFVGVNDGGTTESGLAAQIYADKYVDGKWQGAKLDVTNEGMYYTVGNKSFAERAVAANEIATVGKISDEATARQTADANLQSNIDAEEAARIAADALKVDKPVEPVAGQGVNVPYYFDVTYEATKAVVKDYTVDLLDNTKAPQVFSLDINAASATTAGLMTASHYEKMEGLIPLTSAEIEAICQ